MDEKNLWTIITALVVTALAVGGGVFFMRQRDIAGIENDLISQQKENEELNKKNSELEEKISKLQNQIAQFQAKETPSKEEGSNEPQISEKAMGYIESIYEKTEKKYLDIDYVQWLTGDEAIKAIKEDGKCPSEIYPDPSYCIPNGYYIRNQNPKIRTFEISNSAKITRTSAFEDASSGIKVINYEEFKNLFASKDSYFYSIPFHINVIGNIITEITEQYIP